jgi:hypothetical protein
VVAERALPEAEGIVYEEANGVDIFEVQEIIDISIGKRVGKHVLMWTIWWKGYSKEQSTCEYEDEINPGLVKAWNAQNAGAFRTCSEKLIQMQQAANTSRKRQPNQAASCDDLGVILPPIDYSRAGRARNPAPSKDL